MFEHVLDLDCCIESDVREFCMESTSDTQSMCGTIEEVWIAKSDMAHALCYLCTNICHYDLGRYGEETSPVDWCNRTMEAGMLAATRRFGVSCQQLFAISLQASITIRWWELLAFWHYERSTLYPGGAALLARTDTGNR